MENQEKKYVGSGKQTHDSYVNISIELSSPHIKDNMFEYNGKKYLKLTVGKKKEADQYGKTHYVCINDYKPEEETQQVAEPTQGVEPNELPF